MERASVATAEAIDDLASAVVRLEKVASADCPSISTRVGNALCHVQLGLDALDKLKSTDA
jgi:hypothetical protein